MFWVRYELGRLAYALGMKSTARALVGEATFRAWEHGEGPFS